MQEKGKKKIGYGGWSGEEWRLLYEEAFYGLRWGLVLVVCGWGSVFMYDACMCGWGFLERDRGLRDWQKIAEACCCGKLGFRLF